MRVALVILHADPSRGGAERYTVDLAKALAKRGHDVALLASSFSDEIAGVRSVGLETRGATRQRRYKTFLGSVDRELDRTSYDIVHAMLPVRRCDVYHPHAGMAAEQTRKWNRIFNPRRIAMADVERGLLLGNTRPPITIALSEYVKRSILQHYPLPHGQLATLFNAVDLEQFVPVERPQTEVVEGLIVAQDFERKGVKELYAAAEKVVGDPGSLKLHITVVGGEAPRTWNGTADALDGRDFFSFAGTHSSALSFYENADFFVLPTKHDPCSLVVLEALAMGLPVISTIYNGATEVMTDGVHGFILKDPRDINGLAMAIRKLLDPQLRARMREACLALRPKLSYEHHLDGLIAIYERALKRR